MKLVLVTDAWQPQVNGVVTTLVELVRELRDQGHTVEVIHPGLFKTRPCPGYAGIDLAVRPAKALAQMLQAASPDAIHLSGIADSFIYRTNTLLMCACRVDGTCFDADCFMCHWLPSRICISISRPRLNISWYFKPSFIVPDCFFSCS